LLKNAAMFYVANNIMVMYKMDKFQPNPDKPSLIKISRKGAKTLSFQTNISSLFFFASFAALRDIL